jgi:hypothetical protein
MPTNANPRTVFLAPSQFINSPRAACCLDFVGAETRAAAGLTAQVGDLRMSKRRTPIELSALVKAPAGQLTES